MTETKPLRAAIYARQSVKEEQGIEQQVAACRGRIQAEGWTEADLYIDNATSASKPRGPSTQWARMLADVDAARIDVIVAARSGRLLRTMEDVVKLTKPRRNVRVVTLDGADTATGPGTTFLAVLTAFMQNEITEKEDRALPYREKRRSMGHPAPGSPPYGYVHVPKPSGVSPDPRKSHYEIVDGQAEVVRNVFSNFNGGTSLHTIAVELNKTEHRPIRGGDWTALLLRRMVINPAYAALLTPKGTARAGGNEKVQLSDCVAGAWEALVTEDQLIDARDKALDARRTTNGGVTTSRWLLPGIATCGACGGRIRSAMNGGKRAYRCTIGHFHRTAQPIEDYIVGKIVDVIERADPREVAADQAPVIEGLRAALAASRVKRKELLDLYDNGTLSADELTTRRLAVEDDATRITEELQELARRSPLADAVTAVDVGAHWDALALDRQRAIVRALAASIEISGVGNGVRTLTAEQVAPTVAITWRSAEQRYHFSGVVVQGAGKVPTGAKIDLAVLLSTND